MENRFPVKTVYFCGDCEDEVVGLPAGSRIPSGRPLCLLCTQIGINEGWAKQHEDLPDERLYEAPAKTGTVFTAIMIGVFIIAAYVYAVMSLIFSDRKN